MNKTFIKYMPVALVLAALSLVFCTESVNKHDNAALQSVQSQQLPDDTDSVNMTLSDVNCWVENNQFNIVGLVDNYDFEWFETWLRLQIVDASGKPLTVEGKAEKVLTPHAPAIPPRGRSAFFVAINLTDIEGGAPDSIRLIQAEGRKVPVGPILIVSKQDVIRMLRPNPEGADKDPVESAVLVNGAVNNPLGIGSQNPCIEMLLYGNDKKLYFAQPLDMIRDTISIKTAFTSGPGIGAGNEVEFRSIISYGALPKPLEMSKIMRVDLLAFDGRREYAATKNGN